MGMGSTRLARENVITIILPKALGNPALERHITCKDKESSMPLPLFLAMLAFVVVAAGSTLALAFWIDVPLLALGFAALAGSVMIGAKQWR